MAQHDMLANYSELVQVGFNHDNDQDDIPDTNDPFELA